MPDIIIDELKVRTKIMKLNTQKSIGPDRISAILLQKAVDVFVPILTKLFVKSYDDGNIPKLMKAANIVPIFKCGDKRSPNNYRPVSITSVISKIYESIIRDDLQNHIDLHNIIIKNQHGLCASKSTSTNLLDFWNDVTDAPENLTSLSIIYTDIKKAFDSVPHDLLLIKLKRYSIRGKNLKFFESYLNGRSQVVVISGEKSKSVPVMSGVRQGGVLSGTLFTLYINDLPDVLKFCKISMYADDAKIYAPITEPKDIDRVQQDLDRVVEWCNMWRLRLNGEKCFLL